jgi:hypothetical protein
MTISESFALVSFTLFSFADLRYRLVPGIELFFLGAILLALPITPIATGLIRQPGRYYLLGMGIEKESSVGLICWRSVDSLACCRFLRFFSHYWVWNCGEESGSEGSWVQFLPCRACYLES